MLLLPLPVPNACVTVFPRLRDASFQDFDPKAGMVLVVAGKVTVGAAAMNLVLAVIGHELEVTHDGLVLSSMSASPPLSSTGYDGLGRYYRGRV